MKAEIDKLDINKLVNVPTGFNYLKRKVDIDVDKLKTVPEDLKKLSNEVTTKYKLSHFHLQGEEGPSCYVRVNVHL